MFEVIDISVLSAENMGMNHQAWFTNICKHLCPATFIESTEKLCVLAAPLNLILDLCFPV